MVLSFDVASDFLVPGPVMWDVRCEYRSSPLHKTKLVYTSYVQARDRFALSASRSVLNVMSFDVACNIYIVESEEEEEEEEEDLAG